MVVLTVGRLTLIFVGLSSSSSSGAGVGERGVNTAAWTAERGILLGISLTFVPG